MVKINMITPSTNFHYNFSTTILAPNIMVAPWLYNALLIQTRIEWCKVIEINTTCVHIRLSMVEKIFLMVGNGDNNTNISNFLKLIYIPIVN
jgi:hypothetical protein